MEICGFGDVFFGGDHKKTRGEGGGVKNGRMTVILKKGLEDGGMVVEEFHLKFVVKLFLKPSYC